jgi:hypothetical protein
MDLLPDELYDNILGFLSIKEKIIVREVCILFESRIKKINLTINKLENNLKRLHSIEKKLCKDLFLTINNNFAMYTDYTQNGIHTLFRINNHQYTRCIVDGCREKRLGNIYLALNRYHYRYDYPAGWNFYSKRIIPYCLNCYNKWG